MRQVILNDKDFGDGQRLSYQEKELANAPIIPQPVEYEDIDKEMVDFLTKSINMSTDEGVEIPTFTLFSNQRFSEYSQTWDHTDKDGNLLMNFKTITRETTPQWGTLYGGAYSIPGNNRFTLCMREVIDDNGTECYEVTSMSQPLQIDLKYVLSIITSKFDKINQFNTMINALFSSKQCYIRPNGHYMPTILDSISDNTDYTIDGRKFFIQSASITVLGYVIPRDDIKVQLVPKRHILSTNLDNFKKTYVSMDFDDDDDTKFQLKIDFKNGVRKVSFNIEDDMEIELSETINANGVSIKINDDDFDISGKIKINSGDNVKISIKQPKSKENSRLIFNGVITE